MFIIRFIRYIKGYVLFTAKGAYVERFLNLLVRNGIHVWDGKKTKDTFSGYTLVKNYKKIRPIVKKTGVRIHIQGRYGAPFKVKQYSKRKGIFVGIAAFTAVLAIMSMFIWNIEVSGNSRIPTSSITERLSELGIKRGCLRYGIDARDIEQKMRLSFSDLSWIAVNLRGSTAAIEIKERVMPPEKIDNNQPCNVIAAKSGQIKYMEVYNGQCLVTLGDTVKKGDVIVSGVIEDKTQHAYLKQARAKIIAQTSEAYRIEIPLEKTVFVCNEEPLENKYLEIASLKLPLSIPKTTAKKYRTGEEICIIKIAGLTLPAKLVTQTIYPLSESCIKINSSEAKRLAVGRLMQIETALKSNDGKIISKRTNGIAQDDVYILQAIYICEENIALTQEILLDN
ncbi:MAG: sporulation protein YqfD [Oscillospiraceae bacterium]